MKKLFVFIMVALIAAPVGAATRKKIKKNKKYEVIKKDKTKKAPRTVVLPMRQGERGDLAD